jgi:hypothetical protein
MNGSQAGGRPLDLAFSQGEYGAEGSIGNVNDRSIHDILNGAIVRRILAHHGLSFLTCRWLPTVIDAAKWMALSLSLVNRRS